MKNLLYLILSSFFLLISCNSSQIENDNALILDFHQVRVNDLHLDMDFIKLETNDSCFIDKGILQIESHSDALYILTSGKNRSILVFDNSGKFVSKIGDKGNGPGEYIIPVSFSLDLFNEIISIVDIAQRKIIKYDLKTYKYISEINMIYDNYCFEFLGKDKIVWKNISYENDLSDWNFILTDFDYNFIDKKVRKKFITGYSTGPSKNIYKYNNSVYAYSQYDPIIYSINEDNTILNQYHLKFGKYNLPDIDYLEGISKDNRNFISTLDVSNFVSYYCVFDTEQTLCVYYSVSQNSYMGLYNKSNSEIYSIHKIEFENLLEVGEIERMVGIMGDYVIAPLQPFKLLEKKNVGYKFNSQLDSLLSITSEEDNPILFLFKTLR